MGSPSSSWSLPEPNQQREQQLRNHYYSSSYKEDVLSSSLWKNQNASTVSLQKAAKAATKRISVDTNFNNTSSSSSTSSESWTLVPTFENTDSASNAKRSLTGTKRSIDVIEEVDNEDEEEMSDDDESLCSSNSDSNTNKSNEECASNASSITLMERAMVHRLEEEFEQLGLKKCRGSSRRRRLFNRIAAGGYSNAKWVIHNSTNVKNNRPTTKTTMLLKTSSNKAEKERLLRLSWISSRSRRDLEQRMVAIINNNY